ncbi:MAG TPA: tetratricopeptide repeat protein [Chondromyces sp.]|nr:tetratricopeptide repeat protein [Chondromyces sp.]
MTGHRAWGSGRALAVGAVLLLGGAPSGTCDEAGGAVGEQRLETLETVPIGGVTGWAAALLMSGESGGDVEGALAWTSTVPAGASQQATVTVFVEVDGRTLLGDSSRSETTIEVFGYLVDGTGAIVGHLAEEVPVVDAETLAAIRDGGLKFVGTLSAQSGASSLRVAIRDRERGRYFLGTIVIEVPDARPGGRILLPPLAAETDGRWVVASRRDLAHTAGWADLPQGATYPSARPVWPSSAALSLAAVSAGDTDDLRVAARLVDPTGSVVASPAVASGAGGVAADGAVVHLLEVAPPQAPPGVYRLEVWAEGTKGAEARTMTVVVSDDPNVTRWTDPAAPRALRSEALVGSAVAAYEEATRGDAEEPSAGEPEAELIDPVDDPLCAGPATDAGAAALTSIASAELAGVDAGAAALLMSGQSGGQVEGAVIWTPMAAADATGRTPVMVVVEIDGRGLVEGSVRLPVPIEIYGYLLDGSGNALQHIAEGLLVDGCRQVRAVRDGGLRFVGVVPAPAGRSSLRIIVRNRETRSFFLARQDLEVPGGEPAAFFLGPPLVASAGGRWVATGEILSDPAAARPQVPGIESWPSGRPVWRSREPLELVLDLTVPGGEPQLKAQLTDSAGMLLSDPELQLGPEAGSAAGVVFRLATLSAPDVPPGEYRLTVVLVDSDRGETFSRSLPVVIHDVEGLDAWIDPRAPRTAKPPRPERAAAGPSVGLPDAGLREGYLDALRQWSRDDKVSARRRLAELERPPPGVDPAKRWRQLFTEERLAILALAKDRPETILAVAMLHRDMHAWYMTRRETDLAEHSWQMSAMLARVAPSLDGLQPPPGFSECLLVDLATQLARSGQWRGARSALEAAVEVAPDSAPAQLGLGALLERTGDPKAAAEELQKLVRAHPENLEGRLRLGVNRARLGDVNEARELFRSLLDPSTRLWIRTLAYQELARLLISSGRADEAAELMRAAVGAIPENQRLRILESYALEAAGRSRESAAAAERLGVEMAQQSTSPRYRYSRWPELEEERVRAVLGEAEAMGGAALREALP